MTDLSDLPIRAVFADKEPYGAPEHRVSVRLNVNENTHPTPDDVAEDIITALANTIRGVNRYPDSEFVELRMALASYLGHDLTPEQVWAANGSNEVLQQILQVFGGPDRSLMSFTPTYSMYPLLADATATGWIAVPRPADYVLTPEFVVEAIRAQSPDVVILCGPNNPTGTQLDPDVVTAAYDAFDGMLVIDEAYIEFDAETPSAVELLVDRPRLIVSRTMSKAFGFAGVRLGYLAADPAVINALRLVRLPYHLSALTQVAATTALHHSQRLLETVDNIRQQRDRLAKVLIELGYQVHDSGSNFLLVGGFTDPEATFETLLAQGILIRNLNIPGHLRLTAGTPEETSTLIEAITALGPGGAQSL